MTNERKMFIGGEWRGSSQVQPVVSPYNQEPIASVAMATEAEIETALQRAADAVPAMRRLATHQRAEALQKVVGGLTTRREAFARTIAGEAGKPITDARAEVGRAIFTFSVAVEETKRLGEGEVIPLDLIASGEGRTGLTRRFPVGPILGISPFNFPLNLVAHKIAPAVASGNPIILKPASKTPLTALLLAEVIADAGLPPGAVSVVPCSNALAERMVTDPRIAMLTFTGSPPVGWALKQKAGKRRVVLELGGNAGVIIHQDAEMDHAAKRCLAGGFSYAGQSCISVQRIYVHDEIYKDFVGRFVKLVGGLKMGDPMDETTAVGPLINTEAADRVEQWLREAMEGGAKVMVGGHRKGNFIEPTVLVDVRPEMRVSCQEVFAPVVTLETYKTFDEALHRVNDSAYGLQAGVFTRDIKRVFEAFEALEVGGVIINDVPTYRVDHMPYGGVKDSGFGREGIRYAIEEMTELRLLVLNLA